MNLNDNLFSSKSDRDKFVQSSGGMGNKLMTDSINSAFDASDKAGQGFFSDFFANDNNDKTSPDWNLFNEGYNAAKTTAWDDWWDGDDTASQLDFSKAAPSWGEWGNWSTQLGDNARNNLNAYTSQVGVDADGNINYLPPWMNAEAGLHEAIADSGEEADMRLGAASDKYNADWNSINTHAAGMESALDPYKTSVTTALGTRETDLEGALDPYKTSISSALGARATDLKSALDPYGSAMTSASERLRQTQLDNAASKYQAIRDVLHGDTLAGQRSTERGTTGSTNRLLLGARAKAAQDRSAIEEAANIGHAQREYSLEGQLAATLKEIEDQATAGEYTLEGEIASAKKSITDQTTADTYSLENQIASAKKAISDEKVQKRLVIEQTLSEDREAIITDFAAVLGITREETAGMVELTDEVALQLAEKHNMNIATIKEARLAMLGQLAETAKLGGAQFDEYINDLFRQLDQLSQEDALTKAEQEARMQNLPYLQSAIKEVLSANPELAQNQADINALGKFITDYFNISGGTPAVNFAAQPIAKTMSALEATLPSSDLEDGGVRESGDILSKLLPTLNTNIEKAVQEANSGGTVTPTDSKEIVNNMCWVAREVYGEYNPRWLLFRRWLLGSSPEWFRNLYISKGRVFANWLSSNTWLKPFVRRWMDGRIRSQS
jgi:type II secretory pathway pseudopilin PulG